MGKNAKKQIKASMEIKDVERLLKIVSIIVKEEVFSVIQNEELARKLLVSIHVRLYDHIEANELMIESIMADFRHERKWQKRKT